MEGIGHVKEGEEISFVFLHHLDLGPDPGTLTFSTDVSMYLFFSRQVDNLCVITKKIPLMLRRLIGRNWLMSAASFSLGISAALALRHTLGINKHHTLYLLQFWRASIQMELRMLNRWDVRLDN